VLAETRLEAAQVHRLHYKNNVGPVDLVGIEHAIGVICEAGRVRFDAIPRREHLRGRRASQPIARADEQRVDHAAALCGTAVGVLAGAARTISAAVERTFATTTAVTAWCCAPRSRAVAVDPRLALTAAFALLERTSTSRTSISRAITSRTGPATIIT
jgi:hypothetical protein